ncbi:MAG TPA: nuclear transport factor 2 family protein [Chitinophagaceae bacterium]|nr:nuclear transport factor 2 family protein [Chitinophagaceae bacterium]
MKHVFTICLLFISLAGIAQVDSISLKNAVAELDKALVNKDEKALVQLLHPNVSYGHSNGWVQSKADIISDLRSGKLTYDKIDNTSLAIVAINNNWATVRTNTNATGRSTAVPTFELKLHVLQVWLKTESGWQLLARQGTKL